jgi:hypothetical protein
MYGAVASLILVTVLWAVWRSLGRESKAPLRSVKSEVKSARKDALTALDQLSKLVADGHGREYAIESSAVIRTYIERRFGLRAPVLVTSEFLEHARESPHLGAHHAEILGDYLQRCDRLKFGRGQADRAELEQIHASAIRFVMETRYSKEEAAV